MTQPTTAIDPRTEIEKTLAWLLAPEQVSELRTLGVVRPDYRRPHTEAGYFDKEHREVLKDAALELTAIAKGVYVVMNPLKPALLARSANRVQADISTTSDADIQRRRMILLDIDAGNPSDTSSSEEEHQRAIDTAWYIYKYLRAAGWPDMGVADSGNGAHIYIPVDLPVDDKGLVRRFLQAASLKFDHDGVKVDTSVFNPARITKLIGTWARKGDSLPERQHRCSHWLHVPDSIEPVPVATLEDFAACVSEDQPRQARGDFDLDRWIAEHGIPVRRGPDTWTGGGNGARRWQLAECINGHTDQAPYLAQLGNGAIAAGCLHNSCGWGWKELRQHYEPEYDPNRGYEHRNGVAPTSVNGRANTEYAEPEPENVEWEPPIPFSEIAGAPFPVDTLPGQVGAYAEAQAHAIQVPLDLTGCLVLGNASAVCRGLFEVALNPEWHELVCDYFVPALPSGERKSQTFKRVTAPLEEVERERVKTSEPEIERAKTEKDIKEKRLQELKNKAAKETDDLESEALLKQAAELAVEVQNMKVPKTPRFIADDATAEAVTKLLDDYNGTMAIMSTEGGLFDTIAGRYSDGIANLDIFTKAYTGDAHRTDRNSNQPRFILRPCLTLCISPQPDVLIGMGKNRTFRARGFLARMKFSVPKSMVGYRSNTAVPVPEYLRQHWHQVVRTILRIPPSQDGKPRLLHLSDGAFRMFQQYREEVEVQLRPGGALDEISDWGNRLPGTVARHAALLHILECAEREDMEPWNTTISADTVSAAIRLARYFTDHALIAFTLMRNGGRATHARRIWDFIVRNIERYRDAPVPRRELWMNLRNSFQDMDEFSSALKELEDMNYIRQLPPPPRKVGRQPGPKFEVNPLAQYSQYSQNAEFREFREYCAGSDGIEDSSQRDFDEV